MSSVPEQPTQPSPAPDALSGDLKSDVVDIISDTLQWRLTEARWTQVEQLVAGLYEALQAGNPQAVVGAVTELELAAPLRIIPIGTTPTGPPTPQLRRLAMRIVHELGEDLPSDDPLDGPADDSQDDTGAGHGTSGR